MKKTVLYVLLVFCCLSLISVCVSCSLASQIVASNLNSDFVLNIVPNEDSASTTIVTQSLSGASVSDVSSSFPKYNYLEVLCENHNEIDTYFDLEHGHGYYNNHSHIQVSFTTSENVSVIADEEGYRVDVWSYRGDTFEDGTIINILFATVSPYGTEGVSGVYYLTLLYAYAENKSVDDINNFIDSTYIFAFDDGSIPNIDTVGWQHQYFDFQEIIGDSVGLFCDYSNSHMLGNIFRLSK